MTRPLTPTEDLLLEVIERAGGAPVTYREIISFVYGRGQGGVRLQNLIRRHVCDLRRKVDVEIVALSRRHQEGGYRLAVGPERVPPREDGPVPMLPWAEAVQARRRAL